MTAEHFVRWLHDCDVDYFEGRCSQRTRDIRQDRLWDRIEAAGLTDQVVAIQHDEVEQRQRHIEQARKVTA